MIKLHVDDETAIPLSVDSSSAVSMTVSEAFIDRGGSAIQNNKNATPSTSQVVVTPDPGYDALAKVTVEAVPQGALSPIDIDFDDSTGAFTAEARVGTSGYIPNTAFVGGGFQLATQAAATITPSNVQRQAVPAHKYTTGAVMVDPIPSEYIVPSGTKSITANGNNQDVKAYEKVNVNVPNSYAAADEGKVVQSGALVSQSSQTIDTNGTYDTTTKNEVVVNVSGGQDMSPIVDALTGKGVVIPQQGTPSTYAALIEQIEDMIIGKTLTEYSNDHATVLGNSAFQGSFDLESISTPNVEVIGNYAFNDCSSLTVVVFPKVTTINQNAFQRNSQLATADFGSVTSIGTSAFNVCSALTTLILRGNTVCALANINAFASSPFRNSTAAKLYVPSALIDSYKAASNWSSFLKGNNNQVLAIEGSIYENAYADGTPIS